MLPLGNYALIVQFSCLLLNPLWIWTSALTVQAVRVFFRPHVVIVASQGDTFEYGVQNRLTLYTASKEVRGGDHKAHAAMREPFSFCNDEASAVAMLD